MGVGPNHLPTGVPCPTPALVLGLGLGVGLGLGLGFGFGLGLGLARTTCCRDALDGEGRGGHVREEAHDAELVSEPVCEDARRAPLALALALCLHCAASWLRVVALRRYGLGRSAGGYRPPAAPSSQHDERLP